jgi:hypothetical protein
LVFLIILIWSLTIYSLTPRRWNTWFITTTSTSVLRTHFLIKFYKIVILLNNH